MTDRRDPTHDATGSMAPDADLARDGDLAADHDPAPMQGSDRPRANADDPNADGIDGPFTAGALSALLLPRMRERLSGDAATTSLADVAAAGLALNGPPPAALAKRLVAALLGADAVGLGDSVERTPWIGVAQPPRRPAPDRDLLSLHVADFLVVDLETTGGPGGDSTILEIGAVRLAGGAVVDRFQTLVDPVLPIPPFIQMLTGIRDRTVEGAPRLGEAMTAFARWMDRTPNAPFVAHNAPFDEGFVQRALALCGLPPLARPVLCTRRLARRLMPEMHRFGLDALCDRFAIENRARHRALGDADATAELLLILLARARERFGLGSVGELIALHQASVRAVARQAKAHAALPSASPDDAEAPAHVSGLDPGRFLPPLASD